MGRELFDDVFATFLRLSFPPSWNFVFAGLPDPYTSAQVEQKILEHDGILQHQQSLAGGHAFMASSRPSRHRSSSNSSSSVRGSNPDEFCTNCDVPGHTKAKCFSQGGDMHKKKLKFSGKFKVKDRANLAASDHPSESPSPDDSDDLPDETYFMEPEPLSRP